MTNVINATDADYKDVTSTGIVLVDYYAPWCGPCKMISPILDAISTEKVDVKIVKINVDENPVSTKEYGVRNIPALFVLKDGEIKASKFGAATKTDLIKLIDSVQ